MKRYSIQIKNNNDWDLNAKSYFNFENDKDLNIFCYRLCAIHQKEVRAEISSSGSGIYYMPTNADDFLERNGF